MGGIMADGRGRGVGMGGVRNEWGVRGGWISRFKMEAKHG
jgi:hypothetical protein